MTVDRDIDPRLVERGMYVLDAPLNNSGYEWRLIKARWFDKDEAGGRHHIYVETLNEDGNDFMNGIPFYVSWPTGGKEYWTNGQSGFDAANHPMSSSRNEFSVTMHNGDSVHGLGMGQMTPEGYNPGIHTATVLTFQLRRVSITVPPKEPPTGNTDDLAALKEAITQMVNVWTQWLEGLDESTRAIVDEIIEKGKRLP